LLDGSQIHARNVGCLAARPWIKFETIQVRQWFSVDFNFIVIVLLEIAHALHYKQSGRRNESKIVPLARIIGSCRYNKPRR
jgi:hypothetical protein